MDNYNYPVGADNESAPWNQKETPEIELTCDTCITLRKNVVITTTQYDVERCDEDGSVNKEYVGDYKDLVSAMREQHYSLTKLLEILAFYINYDLNNPCGVIFGCEKHELKRILDDCTGWIEDYVEIEGFEI